jgi:glycosyltransferase involved in cell wall biosynthesis
MDNTSIIVPCYNEGRRLDVDEFRSFLNNNSRISFIFVNDGSTDNTNEIIDSIKSFNHEKVKCLTFYENRGKAEAVRCGVLKAIEAGAKNIGYWDADLSTPLEFIYRMIDKINRNVTFVLGSRVQMLGYHIERHPLRHYTGRFFATMASIILDLPVYDTQCGAKVFRNNFEIQKAFSHPFTVNWSFDVELIGRLKIIKRAFDLKPLKESAVEYPLERWIHYCDSKVRAIDLVVGIEELLSLKRAFRNSSYVSKFIL